MASLVAPLRSSHSSTNNLSSCLRFFFSSSLPCTTFIHCSRYLFCLYVLGSVLLFLPSLFRHSKGLAFKLHFYHSSPYGCICYLPFIRLSSPCRFPPKFPTNKIRTVKNSQKKFSTLRIAPRHGRKRDRKCRSWNSTLAAPLIGF